MTNLEKIKEDFIDLTAYGMAEVLSCYWGRMLCPVFKECLGAETSCFDVLTKWLLRECDR